MLVQLRDKVFMVAEVPPVHFCDSWITSSVSKGEPIIWLFFQESQKAPQKTFIFNVA